MQGVACPGSMPQRQVRLAGLDDSDSDECEAVARMPGSGVAARVRLLGLHDSDSDADGVPMECRSSGGTMGQRRVRFKHSVGPPAGASRT